MDNTSPFSKLNCCVIIPTYNNAQTLEQVIEGVATVTSNIIVVNDGSNDNTADILKKLSNVYDIIHLPVNKGKGFALKIAFKRAMEKGYAYAITIDSDGQHKPGQMHLLIEQVEKYPDSLVIGTRTFAQENIPAKSSFANRFSNFWFRFFTGVNLSDTQSGYRLYPLNVIRKMKLYSGRYELELEILVRLAWRKVKLIPVPVDVYYPSPEDRITHFRPFNDFMRISVLNTVLFFVAAFWIKPRNFFRSLNRKTIKAFLKNEVLASKDSNAKIIFSVMFGLFMGIVPIWGYQLITAIALAYLFRLNKVIVIVAANISIPPMIPLILYLSYYTGGLVMGKQVTHLGSLSTITFDSIKNNILQYILGSFIFGAVLALTSGLLLFLLLSFFRKRASKI